MNANGSDGYKLTSLAVWKLAKDANLVEASTPNQPVLRDQYAVEEIAYYSHFGSNSSPLHFISNSPRPPSHFTSNRYHSHYFSNNDLYMEPRAPRRDKKVVVDSNSVFPPFHGGGFLPENLTTASLQRADAELSSEDRLLQKNQKPRHNITFRTQV
jgi:hypothetical protein